MARLGVVGVRLNLMGKALPDFRDAAWNGFLGHIAELDWHVELHANLVDLPGLMAQLLPWGLKLVVDHFGRPDARLGLDQPGFAQLMALGQGGQVWMKVSGIYRLGATAPRNLEFARASLTLLERHFGPERLVWGSDWPHTQHEEHVGFETVMAQLHALECSASLMHALMVQAPQALFKF